MFDWNVVVTLHEGKFRKGFDILKAFGEVQKTGYFNVLAMRVADVRRVMDALSKEATEEPEVLLSIARLMPTIRNFNYHTPEQFEESAREVVTAWIPELGGNEFHVRLHRRGFKGRLSSLAEEQFLDNYIIESLKKARMPGRITFEDPDFIIAAETIGQRAGLSLWSRRALCSYPFLKLD